MTLEEFQTRRRATISPPDRAHLTVHYAYQLLQSCDLDDAKIWALRSLADQPRGDTFALLGDVCEAQGDIPNALTWYEVAEQFKWSKEDRPIEMLVEGIPHRLKALRWQHMENWQNRVPKKAA